MSDKILKEEILKYLRQCYVLEEDYETIHGKHFDSREEGFKELVRIYLTYPAEFIWPTRCEESCLPLMVGLRKYLGELGKKTYLEENIEEFIKGETIGSGYHPHQWHLRRFYTKTADILNKPFGEFYNSIDSKENFEAIYDGLEKLKNEVEKDLQSKNPLQKKLGFGMVSLYDTSLRMAYRHSNEEENHRLMPKKFVYLHAHPLASAKRLRKMGFFNEKVRHRMETEKMQKIFHPYKLHPIDIENFLCVMRKPIALLNGELPKK